jgi:putative transposon-encoded protein
MAHKNKYLKEKVFTVEEGFQLIKHNIPEKKIVNRRGIDTKVLVPKEYIWNIVENKKGIRFELGGHVTKHNTLEVKAYIPEFKNSEIVVHPNEYIRHSYAIRFHEGYNNIETYSYLEFPEDNVDLKDRFKTVDEFIKFINEKDWIKNPVQIEHGERYVVETFSKLKKL